MKQKDIALIVVIAVIAGAISLVTSRVLFVGSGNRQQTVEVAEPISTVFTTPSSKYFNDKSVNPTQTIQIGNSTNPSPFKGTN
ncbi:hypothetical protein BH09PAT3_BH09PAT3_5220 [soil metagenome]